MLCIYLHTLSVKGAIAFLNFCLELYQCDLCLSLDFPEFKSFLLKESNYCFGSQNRLKKSPSVNMLVMGASAAFCNISHDCMHIIAVLTVLCGKLLQV